MKTYLANTPATCQRLVDRLASADVISFDTESAGPLLRNRKWKNGKTFINVHRSTMIGFSIAFPPPSIDEVPASWRKKDGTLRAGKVLEPTAYYVPICHNKRNADYADVERILRRALRVETIWCHNSKHDAKVLLQEGYRLPMFGFADTYVASMLEDPRRESHGLKALAFDLLGRESPEFDTGFYNLTGKEALEYACHDAVNALELGAYFEPRLKELGLTEWFFQTESQFPVVLANMELHGMRIDYDALRAVSKECRDLCNDIGQDWKQMFPDVSITSSDQLQELFREGTWEKFKTTPGGAAATDRDSMEYQLRNLDKDSTGYIAAAMRLNYQGAEKIASTYTLKLIEEAKQFPDGRLHPDYNQGGAGTGRLSSSNPNGQNIPVRSAQGKKVKAAFIPRDEYLFVSADYSQIELRVLAHMAGGKLMRAYRAGADVHQQTADELGCTRDQGKTLNFAIVYGAGPWTLAKQLGITQNEARDFQKAFFDTYPQVKKLMDTTVEKAKRRGAEPYIKTLTGRRVYVPELLAVDRKSYSDGVRKCGNAPIQGSAFDIMKIGMVRARYNLMENSAWNEFVFCVNNLHDEVTYEVHESIAEEVAKTIQFELENAYQLRVPLVAEPKIGKNWAETK